MQRCADRRKAVWTVLFVALLPPRRTDQIESTIKGGHVTVDLHKYVGYTARQTDQTHHVPGEAARGRHNTDDS